jgi:hypothetical protein
VRSYPLRVGRSHRHLHATGSRARELVRSEADGAGGARRRLAVCFHGQRSTLHLAASLHTTFRDADRITQHSPCRVLPAWEQPTVCVTDRGHGTSLRSKPLATGDHHLANPLGRSQGAPTRQSLGQLRSWALAQVRPQLRLANRPAWRKPAKAFGRHLVNGSDVRTNMDN